MTHFTNLFRAGLLATTVAFVGCSSSPMPKMSPMSSGTSTYSAKLSGAAEVPPTNTNGSGTLQATLDEGSRMLRWTMSYSGLSGPATAAHFHGPALAGGNAGVAVPIPSPASPNEGRATLTAEQMKDLMDGKWYVNVHTAANPAGEIRGQLMPR